MIRGAAFHVCIRVSTAAALLALAACGGGGAASPPVAAGTSTSTQATTDISSSAAMPSAVTPSPSPSQSAAPATSAGLVSYPADVANTTLAGAQNVRAVAALANGGYAVAWLSKDSTGASALFMQRYDAQGAKSGDEMRIDYAIGPQEAPAITILRDGRVVVASVSSQAGAGLAVDWTLFMRRFDANGAATGSADVVVASQSDDPGATGVHQSLVQPVLLALDDGGLALGWASVQQTSLGTSTAQHVQRFDANLQAVGATQEFAATGADRNTSLELVAQPGGFVAGVTHRFQGISYVQFRIGTRDIGPLDDAGAGLPEFNTTLTPLAGGGYILWSTGSAGGYMQTLDGGGRPVGAAMPVAVVPETAVGLSDGGWVTVVRQLYGAPSLAQRFDSSGTATGAAVNMEAGMSRPLIVSNVGNGFALAWSFTGSLGDSDVKTQRVDAR